MCHDPILLCVVIYAAIGLDAVGIGLIFPILPRLIAEVTHAQNIASYIGILTALYAAMQFAFAPVLGALSDRLGRRPVLLLSLGGAAVNYVLMALAPSLGLLILGRAIAGLTSANIAVATAYITDISPENVRAKRFGLFNAMFGVGFILGPVLGGALGDYWLRLPFLAAAALNAANLLLALFVLPESRTPTREKIDLAALNPLRPLRWAPSMKALLPMIATFFVLSATGEVYGTCWALWGNDAFGWNGMWVGLSLGAFGVCQTLAQAFLPGPAARHASGRRGAAGPVPGRAGLGDEPRVDHRPAWLFELLFRRARRMAGGDLAVGAGRQRDRDPARPAVAVRIDPGPRRRRVMRSGDAPDRTSRRQAAACSPD